MVEDTHTTSPPPSRLTPHTSLLPPPLISSLSHLPPPLSPYPPLPTPLRSLPPLLQISETRNVLKYMERIAAINKEKAAGSGVASHKRVLAAAAELAGGSDPMAGERRNAARMGSGGMWWDVVGSGGMWRDVVGCGGMWWDVVGCDLMPRDVVGAHTMGSHMMGSHTGSHCADCDGIPLR